MTAKRKAVGAYMEDKAGFVVYDPTTDQYKTEFGWSAMLINAKIYDTSTQAVLTDKRQVVISVIKRIILGNIVTEDKVYAPSNFGQQC